MKFLRHFLIFPMLFALTALAGCGQTAKDTEAINTYRAKAESALEEISASYDRLEALDAEDTADREDFLSAIGDLKAAMEEAASIRAPEELSDAHALLQEASGDMDKAADDFTSAFSSEPPDEDLLKTATSEYQKAQDTLQSAITSLRTAGSSS